MESNLNGLLIQTGLENADSVYELCLGSKFSPSEILKRDSNLTLRDCQVTGCAQRLWLNQTYDLDGIVATFSSLKDILVPFSYLNILPRGRNSLIPVFNILRKHLKLEVYNKKALQYLRWSQGIQIVGDHGFQFLITLLPKSGPLRLFKNFSRQQIENLQFEFYESFRLSLANKCKGLPEQDITRNTFKKNKIIDIRTWHVLPDDREFVLNLLCQTENSLPRDENFEFIIIAHRFGDRNSNAMNITEYDTANASTTIHAAVTLSSPILNQNLFWSRSGIQDIIGDRGTLYSSLSFRSCCNFQTNLDGRSIDISGDLRQLCTCPETLRFLQMYADLPHMSSSSIHPVFGCIASCGVLHGNIQKALENRASEYLTSIQENILKLGISNARLEIVCETKKENMLCAERYISKSALSVLLTKHPIIVPIINDLYKENFSFTKSIRMLGTYLLESLRDLYVKNCKMGGFLNVWKCYQYELACEILFKGRPNSAADNNFGINLGPGGCFPSRCSTWEQGFLCLDDATACAFDECSLPPLTFWALSECQKQSIKKIVNFSGVMDGGIIAIGIRSVILLIHDLQTDPSRIAKCDRSLLSDLRTQDLPCWAVLAGQITVHNLCGRLCRKKIYKPPFVFWRAIEFIEMLQMKPVDVLEIGFNHFKLNYFPDVRFTDRANNSKMHWPNNGVVRITGYSNENSVLAKTSQFSTDVIWFLENEGLVHMSKFREYLSVQDNFTFPWMCSILEKLSDYSATNDVLLQVISYLSCIGLLQNRWYVHYCKFSKLHNKILTNIPKIESVLQSREILSRFRLNSIHRLHIFRLHSSLELSIPEPVTKVSTVSSEDDLTDDDNRISTENKDDSDDSSTEEPPNIEHENISKEGRRHLPAGLTMKWSSNEIEVLDFIISLKIQSEKDAYMRYKAACTSRRIADRSFSAFKSKYHRLMKS